jgi:hypothetical protein
MYQSEFMVIAAVAPGRESALRQLLETMNAEPGIADPSNTLLPFGRFDRLHFARLVLLEDSTLGDVAAYGLPVPNLPTYLGFMGDCDGPAGELLAEIARGAGPGLQQIFSHCEGFDSRADLLAWMSAHDRPLAANYVNTVGRTVLQIKEESALQRALTAQVRRNSLDSGAEARRRRDELIAFVEAEVRAGRLSLTPPQPTPLGWRIAQIANAIAGALIALIALPFLIVLSPLLAFQLRERETTDPEICPRPDIQLLTTLQRLEDFDVTNQYTAFGSLKPGMFRRCLTTVLLAQVNFFARHVFTRGYLGRVQTIHFARWAFLDGKSRMVFTSNYDGGHQAYMDDFINKAAWGLNLLFSNGIGWPHTQWLVARGARREHLFKYFQRRHQIPTQVWYKAYPGLTLIDLERNHRIRQGLQSTHLSDAEVLAWMRLL